MSGLHPYRFCFLASRAGTTRRALPRHQTRLSLALLATLALAAGCSTGKPPTSASDTATGGSPPNTAGTNTLRYAMTATPTRLDPAMVEDGTTIDLLQSLFEGLVKWDENNKIAPNLAESWELSPDGKTYTFHLKHGVKFHNGRELTAQDFKYSIERACDPKLKSTTASSYLKDIVGVMDRLQKNAPEIAGIKVVDPYTLQITLDGFKPYWLGNMTYPCAFAVCKEAIDANGGGEITAAKAMIGTGPFLIRDYKPNVAIILAANPNYHAGRPKLDGIDRPIITDAGTRLSKYRNDELDIVDVAPSDLDQVNNDPKLKADLKAFSRAAIWYLSMNADAPNSPFGKKEVRQAFAMAIDKQEILRVALKGQADLANGILPPGVPGYNPAIKPIPYDPAKARILLSHAGYPNGKGFPPLGFSFRQDYPQVGKTAEVIQQQLKQNLNIDVQLQGLDWGTFLKENDQKSMPLSHLRWSADYLDAQDFLSTMLHTDHIVNGQRDHSENNVGYSNPDFDRLCDQADSEHDPNKRIALYQQAEQIAVDDAPWVPLYFQKDLELVKPRVQNLRDSLFGHLPHVTTIIAP